MGRVASIDYGLARIGLALSDERQIIASTLGFVPASKKVEYNVEKVLEALQGRNVEEIVIGMPFRLNGKRGLMADEVAHFVSLLREKTSCQVTIWDERLSTVQAERALKEANLSRKKRSKLVDGLTATVILQSYLDHNSLKAYL